MIPSRSVSCRHHAKPAIPVPRARARLHTRAVKFPIEIQGRTLCVRDTLLDEKSFSRICRVTRNLKILGKVSFQDVQAKHLLIPQLFHDCLKLVAASKHIHHFDFTYSLNNPSLGISTLSDENAEDLAQMLKKEELNHLRYIDLTNNQFGYRGLTALVKRSCLLPLNGQILRDILLTLQPVKGLKKSHASIISSMEMKKNLSWEKKMTYGLHERYFMDDKAIACVLLRITLGINIFIHGMIRIFGDYSGFVQQILKEFHDTILPHFSLLIFAWSLPFLETLVGFLLLIGLFTRFAAILGAILIAVLVFGTGLKQNWNVVGIHGRCFDLLFYHSESAIRPLFDRSLDPAQKTR